jgi:hypothetical protein
MSSGISNIISISGYTTATCSLLPLAQICLVPFRLISKSMTILILASTHGDLAQEFVTVPKGDDMFGGGFDDGKEIAGFFKIVLKVDAALVEQGKPGHIEIFHQIPMPDDVHGIQIVKGTFMATSQLFRFSINSYGATGN